MTEQKKIEDSFKSLKPLEHIRTRMGMYVGGNTNPNVIFRECIDNSIDECLGGYANEIHVFSNRGEDESYSGVYDNGRGIPLNLMEHNGEMKPIIQVACSEVNSGSKFDNTDTEGSIGLNGVGIKATNALSSDFYIMARITQENFDKSTEKVKSAWNESHDKNNLYYMFHYQRGEYIEDKVTTVAEMNELLHLEMEDGYSTYTIFQPDSDKWHNTKTTIPVNNFVWLDAIARYFYQNSNIKIFINKKKLDSEFKPYKYTFCKTIELDAWKTADERFRDRMNKKLGLLVTFEFDPQLGQLDSDGSVNSLSSIGKNTDLGIRIVTQGLKDYFHINHNYITLGLKIKTVMMIGEAEFDSQTKERLTGIPGIGRNDWTKFSDEMYNICKHNPEIAEHIALLNEYAASMKQLTNKDLIKSKVYIEGEQVGSSGARLKPAKLRDALGKNREKCDLFIVEGDSAGSGLIDTRDPLTVGVLPLRGVPLNSANLDITDVLENDEMKDLISAIGMGTTELRGSKARYGRIIIAADADIDGLKITALVLGCILRHMPFLIEMGMVYIADSPLYFQDGKYYYKGEEDQMKKNKAYTRFKGLGELNSDQIDDIFFHGNCRLIKVNMEGADYALRLIINKDARKDLMREIGCLRDYLLDQKS